MRRARTACLALSLACLASPADRRSIAQAERPPVLDRVPPPPAPDPVEVKPLPLVAIPDDPPPHEGALFDLPYVIEPPDLLIVEVLEALPGRPISGERLVRPDGTIHLGFYGDVHVRGLTLAQAKVKVIEHLRSFINDVTLGLEREELVEPPAPGAGAPPVAPDGPAKEPRPAGANGRPPLSSRPTAPRPRVRRASERQEPGAVTGPRAPEPQAGPTPRPPTHVNVPGGDVSILIQIRPGSKPGEPPAPAANEPGVEFLPPGPGVNAGPFGADEIRVVRVTPAESDRVFVDVTAYNHTFYYVQGDVASPGKMPCIGSETVLDALNYAGGFLPSADPKTIKLVRPARGGKPTKVYAIDHEAIMEKGDAKANLQLFPGDRLIIGRKPAEATK